MNANSIPSQSEEKPNLTAAMVKRMVQIVVYMLIIGVLLFVSAGNLKWVWGWVYIGLALVQMTVNATVLLRRHPDLVAERAGGAEGTKGWDKPLTVLMLPLFFAIYLVAGLDERFGWSPEIGLAIRLAALIVGVLGQALLLWTMDTNRFFSTAVRIQADRGHTVVSGGPYRFVRHPGYVGMNLSYLAMCLLLGSWWALIPSGLSTALYVIRTALEDKTLQEELPGYKEYAQQTRYRLIPGIW